MRQYLETSLAITNINLKAKPGAILMLRLSLRNQMTEALLLRPALDDWVFDEDSMATVNRIEPAYVYLSVGDVANQIITVEISSDLQPGQILKSWLRFPGVQEEAIFIQLEILAAAQRQEQVVFPLSVTLPFGFESSIQGDATTAGILGLMSGLIDLDKIPSRWLAAELLVLLAQLGKEYTRTQPGRELLHQLQTTAFFRNGAIAFSQASVVDWIAQSLAATSSALGNKPGKGRLLEIWEHWLLSLVETDLETSDLGQAVLTSPFPLKLITKLGVDGDRWFANIILGLSVISPSIADTLKTMPKAVAQWEQRADSYTLLALLSGLDTLAVRWLVLELLLMLRQQGAEFAQTQAGRQLLSQLQRTRFFKNGVLALAASQAPRWLTISQSAASVLHANLGGQPGTQGLLYIWDQWLASLAQNQINSNFFLKEVVKQEPKMTTEQWFADLILGLTLVSPRIAAMVKTITIKAPTLPAKIPQTQALFEDVISGRSMQR